MKNILIIVIIFSSFSFAKLRQNYVYESDFSFGAGLKVSQLLWDHPAKGALREVGGGMGLSQNGFELRTTYYIDEENRFRIPLNLDMIFFRAKERITFSDIALNYDNRANLYTIGTGFHYSFAYFYFANAWVYTGLELNANILSNSEYTYREESYIDASEDRVIGPTDIKNNSVRFGTNIRLGIEAELQRRLMIDLSFNYHIMNLLGNDDNTGQFFVVSSLDNQEDITSFLNFTLMLKYRI